MAEPVYGIDDFPDDDSLWRVEWIGGVGYNTSVPSDPRITVCLTQLPPGETNPLSARLANENNGKDQCWSATIHLNRFGLAAAAANIRTAASFCLMVGLDPGKSSIQAATWNGRTVLSSRPCVPHHSKKLPARPGVSS